jgi:hypothetical protein
MLGYIMPTPLQQTVADLLASGAGKKGYEPLRKLLRTQSQCERDAHGDVLRDAEGHTLLTRLLEEFFDEPQQERGQIVKILLDSHSDQHKADILALICATELQNDRNPFHLAAYYQCNKVMELLV